jgi:hypothetical protein
MPKNHGSPYSLYEWKVQPLGTYSLVWFGDEPGIDGRGALWAYFLSLIFVGLPLSPSWWCMFLLSHLKCFLFGSYWFPSFFLEDTILLILPAFVDLFMAVFFISLYIFCHSKRIKKMMVKREIATKLSKWDD